MGSALRLDGTAVDPDTLGDRFRPAALAEQQIMALVGGVADRIGARRADPERRMRLLHRRRLDDDVLVMPVLAVMREAALGGPRLAQKGEGLLIALVGLRHRNAEAVELAPAVALADAEIKAAVRQQVEGRGLFGEQCR